MTDLNEVKLEALLDIINSSARQAIAEYKKTGHGVPGTDSTTLHPLDLATDTVGLRKAVRILEGACHQLNVSLAPPQHTMMNLVHDCSAYVEIAFQAQIADVLDQFPEGLSVHKLADAVNLDASNTARVLRILSLMGCFQEVERDVFANTRLSLILKSTSNSGYFVTGASKVFSKPSEVLYEAMIDPEFGRSHETKKAPRLIASRKEGKEGSLQVWDGVNNDAERIDRFHRSMIGHNEVIGSLSVLHQYPWDKISSAVDVGSGIGAISIPLAKTFPHLRITNQDLPGTLALAQKEWEKNAPEAVLDGRVEFVPLNFFDESPVAQKDVYYLRSIIHDWPDAEATTILRNIRKVMAQNSLVLIHECSLFHAIQPPGVEACGLSIAPEPMLPNFGAGSHIAFGQDMFMWFNFNAKERTLDELKVIGAAAGLVFHQVYDLVDTMVVEFGIA